MPTPQRARRLTGGDVCDGVSVEEVFEAWNAACAAGDVVAEDVDLDNDPATDPIDLSCIALIDCFLRERRGARPPATRLERTPRRFLLRLHELR
jgi:hypothetical protein